MKLTIWLIFILLSAMTLASCTTPEVVQDAAESTQEIAGDIASGAEELYDDAAESTQEALDNINEGMENPDTQTSTNVVVGWAEMTPNLDIVANAMNSEDHTTLVAAVKAAELVETLQGPGPFTVFAPTNSAFAALPDGTVDTLLMPENKADLQGVLTYHVLAGEYFARDLEDGLTLETVQGQSVTFTYEDAKWYINDAEISIVDAKSSNGVTHVIEGVLVPSSDEA